MTSTDYHWLLLLLCATLLPACATIQGSADSLPTSRPICLSRAEWARVRSAQIKCLAKIQALKDGCAEQRERDAVGYRAALRVMRIDLQQCREEREIEERGRVGDPEVLRRELLEGAKKIEEECDD